MSKGFYKNRRLKSFIFLSACFLVAFIPHANNIENFEKIAIELATNKEKLKKIKNEIKKSIIDTKLFDRNYMRRLNVMPGITGLLQINERNTSDFERWYKYDIEYIDNWSIYLDFKIMIKTPRAIFKSKTKGY